MIWPNEPETDRKYSSIGSSPEPPSLWLFWPSSSTRAWIFMPLSSVARPLKWISASVRVSRADVSFLSSRFIAGSVGAVTVGASSVPPSTSI